MDKAEYQEYLKSDHWKIVREQALVYHGAMCVLCGALEDLQVHHNCYDRLGKEYMSDLTVLCKRCHGKFHGKGAPYEIAARAVTYPEMLNFFYDCGFPSILKGNANSVAHAIMQKWNKLRRPYQFRMANLELQRLSGIRSNIGRARKNVIANCVFNERSLFGYESLGQNSAGIYTVYTEIISHA